MENLNLVEKYLNQIIELCKAHKVKTLYVFGSVLSPKFNKESDIDLLVDFQPIDVLEYGDNYYAFKFALEDMLKREIDLLEQQAIKNPYFLESLDQSKRLIYGY